MEWSPQQEAGLIQVDRWLRAPDGRQVFRMFGYVGTGKTTLARHLAGRVGRPMLALDDGALAQLMTAVPPDARAAWLVRTSPAGSRGQHITAARQKASPW